MGPKRHSKNAFTFFLEEYVENQRQSGRHVSMRVGAEECGPKYKELPQKEKERYIRMAIAHKTYTREEKENKFTSLGVSYAEMERREEQIKKKNEAEDAEIKMTISNLDADSVKSHSFYIVHCNYYCITQNGVYVPGEIAICEFSLGEGVKRTFHKLINPGSIPFGYAYEASLSVKQTHGLPYPPYDEGDADLTEVRKEILEFLEPGKFGTKYPPLYTIQENIKASERILRSLDEEMEEESENDFRVYPLYKMFFWLKNKCVDYCEKVNVGFPVIYIAENELIRDKFCYTPGISCFYHETSEDKYQNCSLSIVQRNAYIICDHCCQHINVELIPGKHCRRNADLTGCPARHFDSAKSRPGRSSRSRGDSEFGGRSSFDESASGYSWKKGSCTTFLHEELEAKFDALDMSATKSSSSQQFSSTCSENKSKGSAWRVPEKQDEISFDDKNFPKLSSTGRGIKRK